MSLALLVIAEILLAVSDLLVELTNEPAAFLVYFGGTERGRLRTKAISFHFRAGNEVAFFLEDTARLGFGAERDNCAAVGTVDGVRRLDAPFLGSPLVRIALRSARKTCEVLLITAFPIGGAGRR